MLELSCIRFVLVERSVQRGYISRSGKYMEAPPAGVSSTWRLAQEIDVCLRERPLTRQLRVYVAETTCVEIKTAGAMMEMVTRTYFLRVITRLPRRKHHEPVVSPQLATPVEPPVVHIQSVIDRPITAQRRALFEARRATCLAVLTGMASKSE